MTSTYYIGCEVVTRRGKRGTVTGYNADGTVNVKFGGKVFPMRETQVIYADVYDRMGKGYAPQSRF